jgi:acetate kinase
VHGGTEYFEPRLVTPELIAALRELVPLAPEHLPHEIKAIEAAQRAYPTLRQIACFDTAFHRHMPRVAQTYALPRYFRDQGLLRYGFHGLSYEYILDELRKVAPETADDRLIIAHLGNGASMAAVRQARSVDTTMGFTPAGGLVMGTRPGDLDPGVIAHLLGKTGLNLAGFNDLVNHQAGLLGISGITSDMKELLGKETTDPHAAEAVELFCYQAKKFLAALTAVLGGLDSLIFTAGIGEDAASIRWRICRDLDYLGIRVDRARNDQNEPVISSAGSPVTVRVMKTNEELMIARHAAKLLANSK